MTVMEYADLTRKYPEHIILIDNGQAIDVVGVGAYILKFLLKYPLAPEHEEWKKSLTAFMRFNYNKLDECTLELKRKRISYVVLGRNIRESFPDNQFLEWKRKIELSDLSVKIGSVVTLIMSDNDELLQTEIVQSTEKVNYRMGKGLGAQPEIVVESGANADGSKISCSSDLGKALLGKHAGDKVSYITNANKIMDVIIVDVKRGL